MKRLGVLKLRADWTRRDPAITAELALNGRNGVPLYLVYAPGDVPARILPELLTSASVTDALSDARVAAWQPLPPDRLALPVVQR